MLNITLLFITCKIVCLLFMSYHVIVVHLLLNLTLKLKHEALTQQKRLITVPNQSSTSFAK